MNAPAIATSLPTKEQVVSFFKQHLVEFQKRLPGYASLRFEITRSASPSSPDVFEVEWGAYHNDSGHCDVPARASLETAIAYHFSHEATKRRIAELREKAEQASKEADALEANIPTA